MTTEVAYPLAPGHRPRRPWLRRIMVGWAVAVLAVTLYSIWHFAPTARDQTTIGQALPTVDSAAADVVRAAGGQAVPAITGYVTVDTGCRITAARDGARYQRWVRLYTAVGTEPALLDGIAARLPARYAPLVAHPATGPVLHADPGNFVIVTGGTVAPGQVRVVVDTGCRPQHGPVVEAIAPDRAPDRAPVEAALAVLGVQAPRWETHRVACAGNGAVWTVQADGSSGSRPLSETLREPEPVLARSDAYAYRSGPAGVAVHVEDGRVSVTATTVCR